MVKERRDEIGNKFLLNREIDIEGLRTLDIQEIIFLIYSSKYYKERQAFIDGNFKEKIQIFFDVLKDRIKDAKELYIAYDKNTNYPYIDAEDKIWIFSKEEFARKAESYFAQQLIMLEMKRVSNEDIIQNFARFHLLGMEKIVIDTGEYSTEINRDDILPPPDWSNTPKINIPITNPNLQHAMIKFFQQLYSRGSYNRRKQVLRKLEDKMLDEVINGRYLIPMKIKIKDTDKPKEEGIVTLKKDTIIEFASLEGEEKTVWQPAFTDWDEFEKVYDKDMWSGNIVTYDDLLYFSESMDGIVINCKGICLYINDNNKKMIEGYKKEKDDIESQAIIEETVNKGTEVVVGESREYPSQMIEVVKIYMKKQKTINKAYLRLMIKDKEKSYLLIVDLDGNKDIIFKGIADVVRPYLSDTALDISEMNEWNENAVKNVEPFYRKKALEIF